MERGGSNLSDKGLNSVDRGSKATLPLTIPRRDLSRLQRILPAAVVIIIQGGPNGAHRTDLANDTRLWEPKLLRRVGTRAAGTCVASSPESDLEAFSHNPAHGSFAPLAFPPSALTNYVPPQPNSPPDNVLRSIDPPASLDLKEGVVTPPPVHGSDSLVRTSSELAVRRPRNSRESCSQSVPGRHATRRLAALAARAVRQQSTGSNWDLRAQPSEPILFPVTDPFCRLPCLHCSIDQRLFTLET
ncbi:hypothetical protein Bca101_101841 [Brassica carinata]